MRLRQPLLSLPVPKSSSSPTSLSSSSLPGTTTAVSAKTKTMLWYRDRSDAEDQMTTQPNSFQQQQPENTNRTVILPLDEVARDDIAERKVTSDTKKKNQFGDLPNFLGTGAVDLSLVKATCLSQGATFACALALLSPALVLSTDVTSSVGIIGSSTSNSVIDSFSMLYWNAIPSVAATVNFHSLLDWRVTPWRLAEGVLATAPLISMGDMVEDSEHRSASALKISVTHTVMALFGRRRQRQNSKSMVDQQQQMSKQDNILSTLSTTTDTAQVVLFGIAIAMVSAVSEELIFRGLLPILLVSCTNSVGLALLGQALIFGIGQIRRDSSVTENGVFSLMQVMNGLWYGGVYLTTGGDILPVLVAHLLYECHVVVGTWKVVNDQMDYTERVSAKTLSTEEELDSGRILTEAGGSLSTETFQIGRRFFYAFDSEHQGTLSLADVKRAVAYAFLQDDIQPSDARAKEVFHQMMELRQSHAGTARVSVENEGGNSAEERLSLSEFLNLLFALKSTAWKNRLA